jgi:large subunit ribosomal protein L29
MAKIQELRELNTNEIQERIDEELDNLVSLRFSHELKQLTNTAKLKESRRTVARLKTILKERQMQETAAAAGTVEETKADTKDGEDA